MTVRHNKKLVWVLAVLVTVIWGVVIYRIVEAVSQGDSGDVTALGPTSVAPSKEGSRVDFKDDVRDPFEFRADVPKKSIAKKDTTANAAWTEPPFKLVGIMQKDKLTTAVLQRNDGATFFVRKGDTLSGVKILSLDQQMVEYTYRSQKKTWKLTPDAK
jgi:hypothetical protein